MSSWQNKLEITENQINSVAVFLSGEIFTASARWSSYKCKQSSYETWIKWKQKFLFVYFPRISRSKRFSVDAIMKAAKSVEINKILCTRGERATTNMELLFFETSKNKEKKILTKKKSRALGKHLLDRKKEASLEKHFSVFVPWCCLKLPTLLMRRWIWLLRLFSFQRVLLLPFEDQGCWIGGI